MLSSAHALTVYTAGPGSLAKSLASGFEQQTGVKHREYHSFFNGHNGVHTTSPEVGVTARTAATRPANLDSELRESLCGEMSRLLRQLGITAVYVTHDRRDPLRLA
jgi:hypothetical protein